MLHLSKKSTASIQSQKAFRYIKESKNSENPYVVVRSRRVMEVSRTGKVVKLLSAPKETKVVAVGVSDDSMIAGALFSSGTILIWNRHIKSYQNFKVPPQLKLAIEKGHCGLAIGNIGVVVLLPDGQVWLWKAEVDFEDFKQILEGHWVHLTGQSLPKLVIAGVGMRKLNFPESRPTSESNRSSRYNTFAYNIRFMEDYVRGQTACILRLWMRAPSEESCSLHMRLIQAQIVEEDKAGNKARRVRKLEEFACTVHLEFWSKRTHAGLLVRLDPSASLAAVALNSSHPFFTHLLFLNPITGIASSRKLCNYVSVEDMPSTTEDGHTSFWIDDMTWSPDANYLLVLFKVGNLSVFSRLGEPVACVVEMLKKPPEPKIFPPLFFTTDPEKFKKYSSKMTGCWSQDQVILSDGFTIVSLAIEQCPTPKDFLPLYIPQETENMDLSINISHDTNPLPSEMDTGPRRKQLDKVILILRSALSNMTNNSYKQIFEQTSTWIGSIFPPQLHEEINYAAISPTPMDSTENKLSSNLILKKKMHAIEVYANFLNLVETQAWTLRPSSELNMWILKLGYNVFHYLLGDHQSLYAFNVIKAIERWTGITLHKMRALCVLYCLVQYRNHQATHINVIYYVIAFVLTRNIPQNIEWEILRGFIKSGMELEEARTLAECEEISTYYYLVGPTKNRIDKSLHFLMGVSQKFEEKTAEVCANLIRGKLQVNENNISPENLLFYAYYLDPSEDYFISPLEISSIPYKSFQNARSLFSCIKSLSFVPIAKENKFKNDSAFIYWSLGVFDKLENLLSPDLAFYAINQLLEELDLNEAFLACKILKKLFLSDNSVKMVGLALPFLQPLFRCYGLEHLKNQLYSSIFESRWKKPSTTLASEIYELKAPKDIHEVLNAFLGLKGKVVLNKDSKTGDWISIDLAEMEPQSQVTREVRNTIPDILKWLWYIRVVEHARSTQLAEWTMRLFSFPEIIHPQKVCRMILESRWEDHEGELVTLYMRNHYFKYMQSDLETFVSVLEGSHRNLHPQLTQALKQPPYSTPWLFDKDFLEFSEKLLNLKPSNLPSCDSVVKSWQYTLRTLSNLYKIEGKLFFSDGIFTYSKETQDWDIEMLINEFGSSSTLIQTPQDTQYFSEVLSYPEPTTPTRPRLPLSVKFQNPSSSSKLSTQRIIGARRVVFSIKAIMKRSVSNLLKRKKKPTLPPLGKNIERKKPGSSSFQFFTVKVNSAKQTQQPIQIKIGHKSEVQQKPAKHRAVQSISQEIIPSQFKPFQLIRVRKSN